MTAAIRAILLGALLTTGCERERAEKGSPVEEHAAEVDHHPGAPGVVVIPTEMLRDLRITTAKAERRPGGEGLAALGEVTVNEEAYAEVGPPIAARVVRMLAAPGDLVTEGQPLVELQGVELGKARADYLAARARSVLAQKALERKKSLTGERIAAPRELEEAEAEAAAAGALLGAARTQLQGLGLPEDEVEKEPRASLVLRAPIAGTVIDRQAVRGQMADPARPMFKIADLKRLRLTVHAFERDAVRVKPGAAARITLPAIPGKTFTGTVILVGQQVEIASRTIPIRIELVGEAELLRPGLSASAWLPVGDRETTIIAVPAASLQRMPDGWCVFVPREEKTFEIRMVGRGRDLGGEVEILTGVAEKETVVVEGAFLLKAEADKARGEGGHHEH